MGGLDLGLFSKSNQPSRRGGLDLGHLGKSNRPSGRGGWTLDFKKERNQVEGGGGLQSDVRIITNGITNASSASQSKQYTYLFLNFARTCARRLSRAIGTLFYLVWFINDANRAESAIYTITAGRPSRPLDIF